MRAFERDASDISHEISCVSTTLGALGYLALEGTPSTDITRAGIDDILFMCANYLDRIAEDIEKGLAG